MRTLFLTSLAFSGCVWVTDAEDRERRAPQQCQPITWYLDVDGDGFGDDAEVRESCQPPGDAALVGGDCDDTNSSLNPDTEWFLDTDGDGFGDPDTMVNLCEGPEGGIRVGGDCDDNDVNTNPDAVEDCAVAGDQDCDGDVNNTDALNCEVFFADLDDDGFGDGDGNCQCVPSDAFPVLVDGDCADEDPEISPGVEEVCADDIDNNCDGTAEGCRLEDDLSVSTDDYAQVQGANTNGFAAIQTEIFRGSLVLSELGDNNIGAVYLIPPPTGPGAISINTGTRIDGVIESGQLGLGMAVGDGDNDGVEDISLGAPQGTFGEAYWFAGPIENALSVTSADVTLTGNGDNDRLGRAMVIADLNGDGVDDWAVSAFVERSVYLFQGPMREELNIADAESTLTDDEEGSRAGITMDVAGDLNGDGVAELMIGADRSNRISNDAGAVFIVEGPITTPDVTLADATWIVLSDAANGALASAIAGVGDVTGDGLDDALIGAGEIDDAYLVPGGADGGTLSTSVLPAQILGPLDSELGAALDRLDDFDGDGVNDVVIGAPAAGVNGEAWVLYGPIEGSYVAPDLRVQAEDGQRLGSSVRGLGDIDGDRYTDLLIGSPSFDAPENNAGAAWLIRGEGL